MISLDLLKSRWHYILLIASAIQFVIIYRQQPSDIINNNPDVQSAIQRAKTLSCKRELEEFAIRHYSIHNHEEPQQLKRTCNLDLTKQRNQKVGCITNITTNELIPLEEKQVANFSICLDLCFMYGHSYGGYSASHESCFCSDNRKILLIGNQNTQCNKNDEFDWYKVNNGIYNPSFKSKSTIQMTDSIATNSTTPARIAFLMVLNGRSNLQIRRLLKNIYSDQHLYYLHVDKRNNYLFDALKDLEFTYKNVILARSRFGTIWGGPSLLRMIIDAFKHLSQYNWDYLINLSESDFPIKSLEALEYYLGSDVSRGGKIYLKSHNIKGYNFIKKQGLDKNFYQCENRVWRLGDRKLPRGIVYSGGSDWFALPKDFCIYIINNLANSKTLVKPLFNLYNNTLLPAESFFHTLVLNSEFCDRFSDNNLRVTNWRRKQSCKCQHKDVVDWCGCSPNVYRWSDLKKLQQTRLKSSLFFSRKFDPTISSSIINAVEQQLVANQSTNNTEGYDTRFWQDIYTTYNHTTDELGQILEQFGLFALKQIEERNNLTQAIQSSVRLDSVVIFFDQDRFVGWIYQYCLDLFCIQLLIKNKKDAHVQNYNNKCFLSGERALKVIEVNHGFDTGERMFRDYRPLNHLSDIVVYHEWSVNLNNKNNSQKKYTSELHFSLFDPQVHLELIQNVQLKGTKKPTRISLAHRLSSPKPLKSGQWTLAITDRNINCLDYKFLIFDNQSFKDEKIDQNIFNKFYNVTNTCILDQTTDDKKDESVKNMSKCSASNWSIFFKT